VTVETIGLGVIVTVLAHLFGVMHYAGRLVERVNGLDERMDRIEKLIDRRWPGP
jgi:Na+-transporting methylmalonyl-CoA/oxaloacetate decarboxylase gamma subunit